LVAFSITTLHDKITAREYVDRLGNQVHPNIQMLFPNNDAISKNTMPPFTQTKLVQSWFEEDEGELQHLPRPP
jgi:hypothetical protein